MSEHVPPLTAEEIDRLSEIPLREVPSETWQRVWRALRDHARLTQELADARADIEQKFACMEDCRREINQLRLRLLSAAGDDLCRLSQEEIKAYTSGAVQIPPIEEFLPSCARFHAQIAAGAGVLEGCLTLAQLIAENERLKLLLGESNDKIAGAGGGTPASLNTANL